MTEWYDGQAEEQEKLIDRIRTENNAKYIELAELRGRYNELLTNRNIMYFILDKIDDYKEEMQTEKNYAVSDRLRAIVPIMYNDRQWVDGEDWVDGYRRWLKERKERKMKARDQMSRD